MFFFVLLNFNGLKPVNLQLLFIISSIIHEEKTKEISGMTVVVYLIQNSAKMALIFNIVDKHEHLDVGVS